MFGSRAQWWFGAIGLCAAAVTLTITGGRGPLAFSILGLPLLALCLLAERRRSIHRFGRFLVLLMVLGCLATVGYTTFVKGSDSGDDQFRTLQRMDAQISGEDTHSMDGRARGRAEAFSQWLQKPLFGWGVGEFEVHDSYLRYPHNLALEILMETGIIGAALFFGAVAGGIFVCLRIVQDGLSGWVDTAILLIFLTDLGDHLSFQGNLADDRIFFAYLGVLIGCGCSLSSALRSGRRQKPVGSMTARAGLPTRVR